MFTLDHLGVVVAALADAVPLYCRLLGVPEDAVEYHDVPSEGVRVAMLKGNTTIELLEPTEPEGALARFLEKRGPGVHHWCFASPAPLEVKVDQLQADGFQVLGEAPRTGAEGRVCFIHPKSAGGMLTEFVEKADA